MDNKDQSVERIATKAVEKAIQKAVVVLLLCALLVYLVNNYFNGGQNRQQIAENVRINSGGTVTLEMLEQQERELNAKCKTFDAAIGTQFCEQTRAVYKALRLPPPNR